MYACIYIFVVLQFKNRKIQTTPNIMFYLLNYQINRNCSSVIVQSKSLYGGKIKRLKVIKLTNFKFIFPSLVLRINTNFNHFY